MPYKGKKPKCKMSKIDLTDNAREVLAFRYLDKEISETPERRFDAVAWHVAKYAPDDELVTEWYKSFKEELFELRFIPNTPCLANAGRPIGQLAACFVIPVYDSVEGIFDALKAAAIVHKTGGGTGFSFSRLRPEGMSVTLSRGVASGPNSFIRVFNAATAEMKQGGIRRGANMGILRVDHPDIEAFIESKLEPGSLQNFNISVALTDEFMKAFERDSDFECIFSHDELDAEMTDDPTSEEKRIAVSAQKIWNKIVHGAWVNGDPGVVFIDTMNRRNPLRAIETIESTNPCGEQPLPPWGSCILGSINLSKMVCGAVWEGGGVPQIDWEQLGQTTRRAVRFLDCSIDASKFPVKAIEEEAKKTRRIGVGIMGLADLFIKLGISYGSSSSFLMADKIMAFIQKTAYDESTKLGEKFGVPEALKALKINRRNGCLTTIAPTGSLSIIAGVSSGVEPWFAFEFEKSCIESTITVHPPIVDEYRNYSSGPLPPFFVSAHDVHITDQIEMLATLQNNVDASISKTVNCPNDTTEAEISSALHTAWVKGVKAVTFYRDGSREDQAQKKVGQILSTPEKEAINPPQPRKDRPQVLDGKTIAVKTGRGKLYLTVNEINGVPFEVFMTIGKTGGEDAAYSEAIGRLISMVFRRGIGVEALIDQLENISGDAVAFDLDTTIKSVPDAIAKVLRKHYCIPVTTTEKANKVVNHTRKHSAALSCPKCGSPLVLEEGCEKCYGCGYSKC